MNTPSWKKGSDVAVMCYRFILDDLKEAKIGTPTERNRLAAMLVPAAVEAFKFFAKEENKEIGHEG